MERKGLEYSLIVVFNCLGASLLISSADLISMYISIELQSFSVYILSSLDTKSESATSAGLKYFLIGGLSSCIILLGIVIIYSSTGLSTFEDIFSLNSVIEIASVNLPSSIDTASIVNTQNMEYANTNIDEIKNMIVLSEANNIKVETPLLLSLTIGLILIFTGFLLKIAAAPFHF
jgi:NADH-ubiquinone oxidoreductase chain 2